MRSLEYISDIHLERISKYPRLLRKSENLALLGDIGNPFKRNYSEFLNFSSNNYERIFLLAGNHEYWHREKREKREKRAVNEKRVNEKILSIVQKFPNIEFLNNSSTSLYGYNIHGTTLWTPYTNSKLHIESVNWLKDKLKYHTKVQLKDNTKDTKDKKDNTKDTKGKNIVLSHYLPSFKMIVEKYKDPIYDDIRNKYATDLEYLFNPSVSLWLCGHSHCVYETHINQIPCAINAASSCTKLIYF